MKNPRRAILEKELSKNRPWLTLHEAASWVGLSYDRFLRKYTPLCTKHKVGIYRLPGIRRKLIDKEDFKRLVTSYQIN